MLEGYVEILVKRKTPVLFKAIASLLGVLGALFILSCLVLGNFGLIVGLVFLLAWYLVSYVSKIEYEYLYVDKGLTIDQINNQTKRKTIAEYDLKGLEILAPMSSQELAYYKESIKKKQDYSSKSKDSNPYGLVVRKGGDLEFIIIEVTDELIKQIKLISPRKVF